MSSGEDEAPREGLEQEPGERAAALPEDPRAAQSTARVIAGCYTLEAPLGEGPFAHTYRARRQADGALVALKVARADLRTDERFKRRLARDVEAAAKLQHMHIAQVFEHGVDDEQGPFLVRELLDGEDLVSAARRGPRTPRRLGDLIVQALSALAEAHRQGVLHRNLKPQNVWVVRDAHGRECVKICDFGKPLRDHAGAEYMAPELRDAQSVDGQVDVYAVGVLLYELLTGEVPFRGANPEETLALHGSAPLIAPRERCPDQPLPRELEAVCMKALAKAPLDRHHSPREMSGAVRAAVALLGARADEPLGSSAFGSASSPSASVERMTMPGEQLRSSTKFWLGAALLAAVCFAVLVNPGDERAADTAPGSAATPSPAQIERGQRALESGMKLLRAGDFTRAVAELRNAERALGDSPEVLRALGEALLMRGDRSEGAAMLARYLELSPHARDREFVERLVRAGQQAH